ncbi:hypothetical protein BN2497_741 [Janthinobacterium sp. CG23_2]|nr:hypothetical protein BN2497_741 [Janthinobacterium sp. CG23_2]CUU26768.1 hypothetical protein BN3177_741 [Janthinobacterium sp. CG23_2]
MSEILECYFLYTLKSHCPQSIIFVRDMKTTVYRKYCQF